MNCTHTRNRWMGTLVPPNIEYELEAAIVDGSCDMLLSSDSSKIVIDFKALKILRNVQQKNTKTKV